jgi:hypothetical protein
MCKILTIACAVLALAAVYFLVKKENKTSPRHTFKARIGPVEFLYLDSTRMLSYLAQLEGGRAGALHRITKQIESASAGLSESGATASAEEQQEEAVESTLSQVESSEMAILLKDLREDRVPRISVHSVDLTRRSGLKRVREGWLVLFQTRYLRRPGYIRPYEALSRAPTMAALFPETIGDRRSEARAERQRAMAREFKGEIGSDPPVTFDVAPPPRGGGRAVKVLLPMQYADLTERSGFEEERGRFGGGRLSVLGMVLRVFRGGERRGGVAPLCGGTLRWCGRGIRPAYTDIATREAWEDPLKYVPGSLLGRISHDCRAFWGIREQHPANREVIEGRHCLLTKLRRQTRLVAPGTVILPVAIFKESPSRPPNRQQPANG